MSSVWGELKRRNVVKVAVAYAIVGWLLIQLAATVFPVLQLPDWTVTFITMLLLLGFPVALLLSWAYELTPEGMKKTKSVPLSESITRATGQKLNYIVTTLLALAVVFLVIDNYVLDGSDQQPEAVEKKSEVVQEPQVELLPNSVAVLPFENMSPDPEDAYFAAGIHEEILNQLTKISALTVIARTTMMRYKDTDRSVPEIAGELRVGAVMEGSVRYAGDQVRVTAQLIDPGTGGHMWSETYDGDPSDIFGFQTDIATAVATALEAELLPAEQARIEQIPSASTAAYALYLKALSVVPDRASAHRHLDQAIKLDPDFALAYAQKALQYAWSLVGTYGIEAVNRSERADTERLARENAERSLAIEPKAPAYSALATIDRVFWRWEEARENYQRALQLNPNDADTLRGYGEHSVSSGRHEEGIRALERALELDPSPFGVAMLGRKLAVVGNLDESIVRLRQAIELAPASGISHLHLAQIQIGLGNHAEALEGLRIAEQLEAVTSVSQILYGHGRLGRQEDAVRLFQQFEEISASRDVGAGAWVLVHLGLGDSEQALHWLGIGVEKIENHEPDEAYYLLILVKTNAWSDPVLNEPRFQELRDRMDALLD